MRTKQLGQARPANTSSVSIFSPEKRDRMRVHNIIICNTAPTSAKYSIFVDIDGTTYDESTAIAYTIPLNGQSTYVWEVFIYMNDPAGNLAVQTDTANALTFTVNGEEGTVASNINS